MNGFAASTLGAPGVELATVCGWIRAAGGSGIELRVGPSEPVDVRMTATSRRMVRELLADNGITPLAVASYVRIAAPGPDDDVIADLSKHLELAADLGARFVRVFPGAGDSSGSPAEADARAAHRLAEICADSATLGVRPVLETHDSHPRGSDVDRVLGLLDALVPGHRVGAIWDLLHPWRSGETPTRTWELLARRVSGGRGYVQVKDVRAADDLTPVLPGTGALPLAEILHSLRRNDDDGWLSLEWERAWYPGIAELPSALTATAQLLRRLIATGVAQ